MPLKLPQSGHTGYLLWKKAEDVCKDAASKLKEDLMHWIFAYLLSVSLYPLSIPILFL